MATIIQIRRDTAATWASVNPTPANGEICFETDTDKVKIGDGVTPWNSLAYWPVAAALPAHTHVEADITDLDHYDSADFATDFAAADLDDLGTKSHTDLDDIGANTHAQVDSHISSTSNPHSVTAAQVGNATAQWNADQIQSEDVVDTGKAADKALVFDGSDIVYAHTDIFVVDSARNSANTTNSFLRSGNGVPTNLTPFVIPFDATLIFVAAINQYTVTETWDARVYANVSSPTLLATVSVVSGYKAYSSFNVNVPAGDEIATYCSGTNISYPRVIAVFRRR